MTTEKAPAPLTPPDCNLEDFPFLPFDIKFLRDSNFTSDVTGEEFRCCILLMSASWHQLPAASLPDNEKDLTRFAGFGKDKRAWRKVQVGALYGWIKCDDGRLYHPVVAAKAIAAWNGKIKRREYLEADRARKETERKKAKENPLSGDENRPDIPSLSDGQEPQVQQMVEKGPSENSYKEIVEKGEEQWKKESDSESTSRRQSMKSDDDVPSSPEQWLEFFRDEHGLTIDISSHKYTEKFLPLGSNWVSAGTSYGQMRAAIAKALNRSSEEISFLPGYINTVLEKQKINTQASTRSHQHGNGEINFSEGVDADGRF